MASRISRVTKPLPSPDVRLEVEHNEVLQGTDFVCLSAFSEVEGPQVIRVVPKQRGFNRKSYALKIMSVDLHNQQYTDLFVEDSQSVIQEGKSRCYVHHSYLLDLRARGYCRPLCFSYITQEADKIMTYFDSLMDEFTHIANILKYGNHLYFIAELEQELEKLEQRLQADPQDSQEQSDQAPDLDYESARGTDGSENQTFYDAESEIENDQLGLLADSDVDSDSADTILSRAAEQQKWKSGNFRSQSSSNTVPLAVLHRSSSHDSQEILNISALNTASSTDTDGKKEEENATDLASHPASHPTDELQSENRMEHSEEDKSSKSDDSSPDLAKAENSSNAEAIVEEEQKKESEVSEKEGEQVAQQKEENTGEEAGNEEEEGEASPVKKLISKSRISRSISLPIGSKKPEEIETKQVEKKDMNPHEAIRILRENIRQARVFYSFGEIGSNKAIGDLVASLSNSKMLKQELHLRLLKKRASSSAELRGFEEICGPAAYSQAMKRIEILRDHFARSMAVLNLEREACRAAVPLATSMTMGNCPVLNFNWENDKSPQNFLLFPNTDIPAALNEAENEPPSFSDTESSSDYESFLDEAEERRPSQSLSPSLSPTIESENNSPKIYTHRASHLTHDIDASRLYDPLFPLHLPTACDFGLVKLESYAAGLWNQSSIIPGQGLFQARNLFDFFPRLVYSLLVGRVLVVHASPRNKLELSRLLRALTIFIPGSWRNDLVTYWQETPLRITDLTSSKLIGLSKEGTPRVPDNIKKYITLLNFDDKILLAPPFDCSFVESVLLPPRRQFPDESSYLAYIHAELYSLVRKASLYYQMCCLGITRPEKPEHGQKDSSTLRFISNDEILRRFAGLGKKKGSHFDLSLTNIPSSLRDESKRLFQQVLEGVDASNLPVIEYLVEVIKEQQAMEQGEIDSKHPILRLIELPCSEFHHRSKKK